MSSNFATACRAYDPSIVIIGAGFAGLYAAMDLDHALGHCKELEILLIDRNNYFLFPPLLPSAGLAP